MTKAVFARYLSGKHFNPTSCGVIRNQRSKIRRSTIRSAAGTLLEKFRNSSDLARSNTGSDRGFMLYC